MRGGGRRYVSCTAAGGGQRAAGGGTSRVRRRATSVLGGFARLVCGGGLVFIGRGSRRSSSATVSSRRWGWGLVSSRRQVVSSAGSHLVGGRVSSRRRLGHRHEREGSGGAAGVIGVGEEERGIGAIAGGLSGGRGGCLRRRGHRGHQGSGVFVIIAGSGGRRSSRAIRLRGSTGGSWGLPHQAGRELTFGQR